VSLLVTAAWLGTFVPTQPAPACTDCKAPKVTASAGAVRVLQPADGAAPDGDVVVASPLLGLVVPAKIDHGQIALGFFPLDLRDGTVSVVLLPSDTVARFVVATPADIVAIKETLIHDDVLSVGVRATALRAFKDLEVGALDLDGDGKADVVATYGCNAWGDGSCQGHGQFFLAKRGAKWVQIE